MQTLELCFIEVVSQFCKERKMPFDEAMKRISQDEAAMFHFLSEASNLQQSILGNLK